MTRVLRHDAMRAHNLEVVLGEVRRGGPLTRAALAERTGLTKSTVSKLVADLLVAGLLAESGPTRDGERGRPGVAVALSGGRVAALGLEINVDYLAVRLLDLTGAVRHEVHRPRDNRASRPSRVLADLRKLAAQAVAEAAREGLDVVGATLAVPGTVGDGVVFGAPNLGWTGVRAAEQLRLPVDVGLENEANLAALGELWFGGQERDFLYVSGEIGVGAGVVVGGELFRGASGLAGELGHVVVAPGGPACRCGGAGCLEAFTGQDALLAAAGELSSVDELLSRLDAGNPQAHKACEEAGRALGLALTSALHLLDLDRIVLGGVFARLAPWLSKPAGRVLKERLISLRGRAPALTASALGTDAATLGAAGKVIHRVLAEPGRYLTRP